MENGIYRDLSIEDYHENKSHYSATQLKEAKKSLAHFKYSLTEVKEKKSHFDFGNAWETALLDIANFDKRVLIYDEAKKQEPDKTMGSTLNKEWKKNIMDSDKYVINATGKESYECIEAMLENCYKDSTIQGLIKNIDYQLSGFWSDSSGLNLKTRPDISLSNKNVVVDVKTCVDGSQQAFNRDICKFEYLIQACLQIQGVIETGIMPSVDKFFWLACEKVAPYNITLYELSKSDREFGMDQLRYLLNKVQQAITEDIFPGYTQEADNKFGILTSNLPLWYRS